MNACGLIVEYNPFHNGHKYHLEKAKEKSNADCLIAVMSGNFLQRGEPAIIDKYDRTKAALASGVDIVIELPYAYAVQSSQYFASGAVQALHAIGVSALCFGSEHGDIEPFISTAQIQSAQDTRYNQEIKHYLDQGLSYPRASAEAMRQIVPDMIDLTKPNNILGLSYVRQVLDNKLPIELLTVKRVNSEYHDATISSPISSATSIRQAVLKNHSLTEPAQQALPESSSHQLRSYQKQAGLWHHWEAYFPYLKYRILSLTRDEMAELHLVDEGIENRIAQTIQKAGSFIEWMNLLKTKRYTWTRLQRMLVHILTNTKKEDIKKIHQTQVSYIRLLGFSQKGQAYLNKKKKELRLPVVTQVNQLDDPSLDLDERASDVYYSILAQEKQIIFHKRKIQGPIIHR